MHDAEEIPPIEAKHAIEVASAVLEELFPKVIASARSANRWTASHFGSVRLEAKGGTSWQPLFCCRIKSMDKQKFAKMALRTTGAWNIRILTDQINPKYQIIAVKNSITSDTGYLELFCIEPLQLGLPTFFGRWDLRPNTVDIDLLGDAAASSAFKNEMNGYRGHHTRVISDSPRIYGIAIQTPSEHVFSGTIELNIGLGVLVQDSFTVQDSAQAYVIPAAG